MNSIKSQNLHQPHGAKSIANPTLSAPRKGENMIAGAKWNYQRAYVSHMFLAGCFFPKVPETSHVKENVLVIDTSRNPSSQLSLGKIAPCRTFQTISFLPTYLAFTLPSVVLCNLHSSVWFGSGKV